MEITTFHLLIQLYQHMDSFLLQVNYVFPKANRDQNILMKLQKHSDWFNINCRAIFHCLSH